jgi:hypothetical protein
MEQLKASEHWTNESVEHFTYRIAADFLAQVETKIENGDVSRAELAQRLNRTAGRVSQLLNNPGNLTVSSAVRLVRAARMKVALVAYDDNDPENNNGPINSAIFYRCWKHMGAPSTFFELTACTAAPVVTYFNSYVVNGSNLNVVSGSNLTVATMGPTPINTNPLWAANVGFGSGSANLNWSTNCGGLGQNMISEKTATTIETSIGTPCMASTAVVN